MNRVIRGLARRGQIMGACMGYGLLCGAALGAAVGAAVVGGTGVVTRGPMLEVLVGAVVAILYGLVVGAFLGLDGGTVAGIIVAIDGGRAGWLCAGLLGGIAPAMLIWSAGFPLNEDVWFGHFVGGLCALFGGYVGFAVGSALQSGTVLPGVQWLVEMINEVTSARPQ